MNRRIDTVMNKDISVKTSSRTDFVDITAEIRSVLEASGVRDGAVDVFVPHTTAGVTINENADPDVLRDMETILDRIVPWTGGYRHAEGNSAAHVKTSLMGSSLRIPVANGRLSLGTWQGVYLCEFDGPRSRRVRIQCAG